MKKIIFGLATLAALALPAVAEDRGRQLDRDLNRRDRDRIVVRYAHDDFGRVDRDRFYHRDFDRDRVVVVRRDSCR